MSVEFFASKSQSLLVSSTPVTDAPLTLACWFYPETIAANCVLFQLSDGSFNNRFGLIALGGVSGDPLRAYTQDGTGDVYADSTTGYKPLIWQHACGVFSSANLRKVYLNAGSTAENTTSRTPAGINRIDIGFRLNGGIPGLFMDGKLAEIGIWNAALTDAEVTALASGVPNKEIRPQNLVFNASLVRDIRDIQSHLVLTNNNGVTIAQDHPQIYRAKSKKRAIMYYAPPTGARRRRILTSMP